MESVDFETGFSQDPTINFSADSVWLKASVELDWFRERGSSKISPSCQGTALLIDFIPTRFQLSTVGLLCRRSLDLAQLPILP